jgi:hypothetical protein
VHLRGSLPCSVPCRSSTLRCSVDGWYIVLVPYAVGPSSSWSRRTTSSVASNSSWSCVTSCSCWIEVALVRRAASAARAAAVYKSAAHATRATATHHCSSRRAARASRSSTAAAASSRAAARSSFSACSLRRHMRCSAASSSLRRCASRCVVAATSRRYTLKVIELLLEEELHDPRRRCSSSVGGVSQTTRAAAALPPMLCVSTSSAPCAPAWLEPSRLLHLDAPSLSRPWEMESKEYPWERRHRALDPSLVCSPAAHRNSPCHRRPHLEKTGVAPSPSRCSPRPTRTRSHTSGSPVHSARASAFAPGSRLRARTRDLP